MVKAKEKLSQ